MEKTKQKPLIKHGWLRALAVFIPWMFSYGLFMLIGNFLAKKLGLHTNNFMLVSQLFGLIGTVFMLWIFTKFIDKKPFYSLGFVKKNVKKDILLGILAGFVMIAVGFFLLNYYGQLTIASISVDYLNIFVGLLLFIVVAFNEELIFRGYMLNNFMDSMPRFWALLVSSFIFGSLHLYNPNIDTIGFGNIILAGFLLGVSYTYTKSLWFPIALHFSWNFFQGTIFGYAVSGNESYSLIKQSRTVDTVWNGGKFGFEASITAVILLLLFIVLIANYYNKKTNEA